MTRVLVWGMTNSRAGTEAVIANIVSSVDEGAAFESIRFAGGRERDKARGIVEAAGFGSEAMAASLVAATVS